MADFKRQGGSLTGREERYDGFEGEPKGVSSVVGKAENDLTGTGSGLSSSGRHTGTSSGLTGHHATGDNYDGTTTTGKKPSLLDRLNPMKDTDGDGKKGVME